MSDIEVVNAIGLSCPQPVILAKEAIEKNEKVKVVVDNEAALENVRRLGSILGCDVVSEAKGGGVFEISLYRKAKRTLPLQEFRAKCETSSASIGHFVIVCGEDKMGRGNAELGTVLIRTFLHTLCQQKDKPDIMIFYNTGVKLTLQGADTLEDLKELAIAGVEILVCGTCLNFFGVKENLGVGVVSNMYDITEITSNAGRLLML